MNDSPAVASQIPDDFVSRDDEELFAFINRLRISVKAKVAAEQQRGRSLTEIIIKVQEMVQIAEGKTQHPKPFPADAIPAISRQAVSWCVDAFEGAGTTAKDSLSFNEGDHE